VVQHAVRHHYVGSPNKGSPGSPRPIGKSECRAMTEIAPAPRRYIPGSHRRLRNRHRPASVGECRLGRSRYPESCFRSGSDRARSHISSDRPR
jgi:hypothetical protein